MAPTTSNHVFLCDINHCICLRRTLGEVLSDVACIPSLVPEPSGLTQSKTDE